MVSPRWLGFQSVKCSVRSKRLEIRPGIRKRNLPCSRAALRNCPPLLVIRFLVAISSSPNETNSSRVPDRTIWSTVSHATDCRNLSSSRSQHTVRRGRTLCVSMREINEIAVDRCASSVKIFGKIIASSWNENTGLGDDKRRETSILLKLPTVTFNVSSLKGILCSCTLRRSTRAFITTRSISRERGHFSPDIPALAGRSELTLRFEESLDRSKTLVFVARTEYSVRV